MSRDLETHFPIIGKWTLGYLQGSDTDESWYVTSKQCKMQTPEYERIVKEQQKLWSRMNVSEDEELQEWVNELWANELEEKWSPVGATFAIKIGGTSTGTEKVDLTMNQ